MKYQEELKSHHHFSKLESSRSESPLPVKHRSKTWSLIKWGVRYFLTVFLVGAVLAAPIYLFRKDMVTLDDIDNTNFDPNSEININGTDYTIYNDDGIDLSISKQTQNLMFYLSIWLLITWSAACVTDMFMLVIPYIFRFFIGFINPSYQRYWRLFRVPRQPVALLGCIIASYISFLYYVNTNRTLIINARQKNPNVWDWDDTIQDVLEQCIFWAIGYLLIKLLVLYITVHYNYRSDQVKISHSKEIRDALVTLYDASIYLHPTGSRHFLIEDKIIRNAFGSDSDSKIRAGASDFFRKIGMDSRKLVQFFGDFIEDTHWLQANSSYSTVERCLANPKSAAALAKRIWVSLVVHGSESLSVEDVAEVLGPYRRDEAIKVFEAIDENDSDDIRLDEMIWTVIESGRIRHAVYRNMHDINHCINTFDWIALFLLAFVMLYFILVSYVDTISQLKDTIYVLLLGLTISLGKVMLRYIYGCVFVFFEHPFDIGDRVNVYNTLAANPVACTVSRLSLLYTVFRRIDNGTDVQITNNRLMLKRIENISRSGINKQAFNICVDFKTSFTDMMFLRHELEAFLKENRRDYEPDLELSVVCIHELNKIEFSVSFQHKSNWSNERLRAIRASKFMCALLVAVRKIPIYKPGGSSAGLGDESNPMYAVQITDDEAAAKMAADKKKKADKRIDAVEAEDEDTTDETDQAAAQKMKEKVEKEAAEKAADATALTSLTSTPAGNHTLYRADYASTGVDSLIHNVSTGLRVKIESGPAAMFF